MAGRRSGGGGMFLLYLIVGLYLINYTLLFVVLPTMFDTINKWIILIGGVLLIIGGIKFLTARRAYAPGY